MTGFNSKRDAAADKLDNDDLTIAYMSGYHDGKKTAQPAQEPVAWRFQSAVGGWAYGKEPPIGSKYAVEPLYTTPPQRKWVGLTDDERLTTLKFIDPQTARLAPGFKQFAEAIESKLKEKNT